MNVRTPSQASLQLNPIVSLGVDWITATTKRGYSEEGFDALSGFLLDGPHQRDNFAKPFSMQGYEGIRCGQVFVGTREDGCMVQVTGESASHHWRRVVQFADNVPRLDLQATIRTSDDPYLVVRRADQHMRRAKKRRGRGPRLRFERSENGGATAYVGERTSRRYGRIYNKFAESGEERYRGCVRWELILRNDLGRWASRGIYCSSDSQGFMGGLIRSYFGEVGARPPRELEVQCPQTPSFPAHDSSTVSDARRMLLWLSTQVQPTVLRLTQRGYVTEVYEALGLSTHGPSGPTSKEET